MKSNASKTKKPSFFSSFLHFRIDELIRPICESAHMFVQIVAHTFVVYKLLPKDYPGLNDDTTPISLFRVIADAWKNVKFTRKELGKSLAFFAVVSILLLSALMVFGFVFSLFTGTAHAQSGPFDVFDESTQQTDLAYRWLHYIFPPDASTSPDYDLPTFDGVFGVANQDIGIRTALQSALAMYSQAILIIAALILFYHLVVMVIQTAHSGVAMGSPQKQVWAPLRLVIAIGLLVPIGGMSSASAGLNSGQYIFIKTAEVGSRLATHVWSVFLDRAMEPGVQTLPNLPAPLASDIATTVIVNMACVKDYNARMAKKRSESVWAKVSEILGMTGLTHPQLADLTAYSSETMMENRWGTLAGWRQGGTLKGSLSGAISWVSEKLIGTEVGQSVLGEENVCGWIFFPAGPDASKLSGSAITAAAQAQTEAVSEMYEAQRQHLATLMLGSFDEVSDRIYDVIDSEEGDGGNYEKSGKEPAEIRNDFREAVAEYQARVNTTVIEYYSRSATSFRAIDNAKAQMDKYGWAMAGAFLTSISRSRAAIVGAVDGALPVVSGPENPDVNFNTTGRAETSTEVNDMEIPSVRQAVFLDLGKFTELMRASFSASYNSEEGEFTTSTDALSAVQCASTNVAYGTNTLASLSGLGGEKVMSYVFSMIDTAASWTGLWSSGTGDGNTCGDGSPTFKLGIQFKSGADALDALTAFGHSAISTGLNLAGWGAIALGAGSVSSKVSSSLGSMLGGFMSKLGQVSSVLGMILITFAMVFLLMGFPFAFIVPLIPFVRFFFGIVAWLGDVIESVVAVPIVALAQLNPDGEGFVGRARVAYHFVLGIALRPVLMIFGLVGGMLMFIVAVNFLTFGYGAAIIAFGGTDVDFQVFSKIAFTAIYVYTVTTCANKCFELVTHIPDHALDWMGEKMPAQVSIADPTQHMQAAEQLATSWVMKESTQKIGSVAKGIGEAGGQTLKWGVGKVRGRIGKDTSSPRETQVDAQDK